MMGRRRLTCVKPSALLKSERGRTIEVGRVSCERMARSPIARGPAGVHPPQLRPPSRLVGRQDGVSRGRPVSAGTDRTPGGIDAHAECPRAWAGRWRETQWVRWAAAGRSLAPGADGPRIEEGLRAAAWVAVVVRVLEVGEDPIDHGSLRDERHDPHGDVFAATGRISGVTLIAACRIVEREFAPRAKIFTSSKRRSPTWPTCTAHT